MSEKIELLNKWIQEAHHIVFFGGAGVSTESGIPDFRSKDGLYNQQYSFPPEEILSHSFFVHHTEEFYRFYRNKMNALTYLPNKAHQKLALLEKAGKLSSIITQNIDGLHQKAGSQKVLELHGSIDRNHCMKCHKSYPAEEVFYSKGAIPTCTCGGTIKPDVVLYEEPLEDTVFSEAVSEIQNADLLIIGGTSLTVYPASSLIHYFNGKHLVLINREVTPFDQRADLVLQENLGTVFSQITIA